MVALFLFWNIARGMKGSASVKLLGRGSGVTSSCLAFELSTGRVTSANVVIVWWWHFYVLEYRPGHEEICFCQAAWQG